MADKAAGDAQRHLALLAVGGYGRQSLCPYSDLDVVLVHTGLEDIKTIADGIWYPVWDEGVQLDHSVRRPQEVLAAAADDVRVALGLLDARMVWGEPRVAEPLLEKAKAAWREKLGTKYLPLLEDQMGARRAAGGDVAFLLEPDLKESHGGLRDVSVLRAIAAYAPELPDYADLGSVDQAAGVLTDIRVELHRMAGREHDKLLLQDQDQVAAALDFPDADDLMATVSNAGRQIAWVSDDVWRRRRLWDPTPAAKRGLLRRRSGADGSPDGPLQPLTDLGPDLTEINGELALTPEAAVSDDTSLPLRLAATAARLDRPIAKTSLYRLADRTPAPGDPWTDETRRALVDLLAQGPPAVDKIESLDQHGLFVRLVPEWAAVRNKPQRNAYHRFTVDRHLLEAAALAAGLTETSNDRTSSSSAPCCTTSARGSRATTRRWASRWSVAWRRVWAFRPPMSRSWWISCVTISCCPIRRRGATSTIPTTIANVARACGNRLTLHLLAALTEADSRATGPSAWGPWKAGLVADLVDRTDNISSRAATSHPPAPDPMPATHRALIDEVRQTALPSVLLQPPQVIVAAPDRRGLLSSVAGALALNGMDVRAANVAGEAGVAVEVFTVEVARGTWPDTAKFREDLAAVLSDRLALDERLSEREQLYAQRRRSAAHLPGSDVGVDNGASETATVLELRALDEIGLLHRVTRALFEADLDVVSARVSTLGEMVVDAFYVRESNGGKVTDPDRLTAVTGALRNELGL